MKTHPFVRAGENQPTPVVTPVKITYDVDTGGTIDKRELPFIVGILADLSGANRPEAVLKYRNMVEIDRDQFDEVLRACRPGVDLSALDNLLPGAASPKLAGILNFEKLADFDASAVVARIEGLPSLFETPEGKSTASRQLSLILQSPSFQALEATWRGLYRLVSRVETGKLLKLRVLNASRQELLNDLEKAVDFDQSSFFKLIYEAEYGTFGGTPYSLLVGAYEFGRDAASIEGLKKIAKVSSAAHAPFIAAADPSLFDLQSFTDLHKPRILAKIFESVELIGWREFRESEDARYVALALPRVLMRVPAGVGDTSASALDFRECLNDSGDPAAPPLHDRLLWGNPAFLLAECIASAFARNRWPAAFRGVESGGLISGLSCFRLDPCAGGAPQVGPTELPITDRRLLELDALGFVALCQRKDTAEAAFLCAKSTSRPRAYFSDEANANAYFASTLPAILTASRFAHYLKVIMREKVGSFLTRANVEAYLNTWISQYVLLDDKASQEVNASYPLRTACIQVSDVPGEPGVYSAAAFLQPHFQVEALTTSIRLEVKLPL